MPQKGVDKTIIPGNASALLEGRFEGCESGRVVGADGAEDLTTGTDASGCGLDVEGVGVWYGVGFVDLQL